VATLSLTPTLAEKTFSGGTESFNQSIEKWFFQLPPLYSSHPVL